MTRYAADWRLVEAEPSALGASSRRPGTRPDADPRLSLVTSSTQLNPTHNLQSSSRSKTRRNGIKQVSQVQSQPLGRPNRLIPSCPSFLGTQTNRSAKAPRPLERIPSLGWISHQSRYALITQRSQSPRTIPLRLSEVQVQVQVQSGSSPRLPRFQVQDPPSLRHLWVIILGLSTSSVLAVHPHPRPHLILYTSPHLRLCRSLPWATSTYPPLRIPVLPNKTFPLLERRIHYPCSCLIPASQARAQAQPAPGPGSQVSGPDFLVVSLRRPPLRPVAKKKTLVAL